MGRLRRMAGKEGLMAVLLRWQYEDGRADAAAEIIDAMQKAQPPADHKMPPGFERMSEQVRRQVMREHVAIAARVGGLPLTRIPDRKDVA